MLHERRTGTCSACLQAGPRRFCCKTYQKKQSTSMTTECSGHEMRRAGCERRCLSLEGLPTEGPTRGQHADVTSHDDACHHRGVSCAVPGWWWYWSINGSTVEHFTLSPSLFTMPAPRICVKRHPQDTFRIEFCCGSRLGRVSSRRKSTVPSC